jgi:hypothetical protein
MLIVLVSVLANGQSGNPPKIFLNSQIVSFDSVFIYPKNLESIVVNKDSAVGKIFIRTKDPVWKYRTIDELLKTTPYYSEIVLDKSVTPIFYIDQKLINKKTNARIDYSYYAIVTLKKLSESKSIDETCKKIVIVDIKLTDTEPKPVIYIRGNTIKEIEDYYKIRK